MAQQEALAFLQQAKQHAQENLAVILAHPPPSASASEPAPFPILHSAGAMPWVAHGISTAIALGNAAVNSGSLLPAQHSTPLRPRTLKPPSDKA